MDATQQTPAAPALVSPTEALLRGFETGDAKGELQQSVPRMAAASDDGLAGTQLREGFRIGELGLMIRYEDGSELLDLPTAYPLPNAPTWFTGMANLHGALVPVFDLARYFGAEHASEARLMLLVLGHGADAAGVVIDGLPSRLRFEAVDRAEGAPIPAALEGCVNQTYWAAERTWMDLQVDALLSRLNQELAAAGQ